MFMFQQWGYCVRVKTYVSKSSEKSPVRFGNFSVFHSVILMAVQMGQMSHCIGFKICNNSEIFFYSGEVFLNGHCLSLGNHCYSVLGLGQ